MMQDTQSKVREMLVWQLKGGHAHAPLDDALKNIPAEYRDKKPHNAPHSLWEIIEHIRIAQWDIVEYCLNPGHVSPEWPAGYWPQSPAPEDGAEWNETLQSISRDLQRFIDLVKNPQTDLLTPLAHTGKATIMREALLIVDHNAYHVGQIVTMRRLIGIWG